jgi:hypothetical protein
MLTSHYLTERVREEEEQCRAIRQARRQECKQAHLQSQGLSHTQLDEMVNEADDLNHDDDDGVWFMLLLMHM